MPYIVFMRHAKTTLNKEGKFAGRTDCDITPEGLEEARKSFKLTKDDFDYYYCSPLKRTQQTLEAVIPGQKPIIDERIIERDLGEWEDKPYDEVPEPLKEKYVKGQYDPVGSETHDNIRRRVCNFVQELFEKYSKDDRILVVTHAGVVRQVRDVFLPEKKKGKIKNSELFTITDEEYEKYMKSNEKSR